MEEAVRREHNTLFTEGVIRDMSEGVLTVGLDGVIGSINPAAEQILERSAAELVGKRFAAQFFEYSENDAFNQAVLDAIYDADSTHRSIVPFFTGERTRQLQVTTSFLRSEGKKVGIVAVLSDISELVELRDAVRAMERIKALNTQLELRNRLLSETFGRFLSDEIVRQLLETPDGLALGGKKRTLTVMMSDLRGFTALSERMDAQKLLHMLNHYLAAMTEVIEDNNGTIIEFIGDGILAIFGAPLPTDTHADDAVRAAVQMQQAMTEVNRWNTEQGYDPLEMGIGINTGEVIVGNIGSEKRTKYGVIGSHVNLCGRIESYTVGGEILISPGTRGEIREPLSVAQEREVLPKGVNTPLALSLVTGIGGVSCTRNAPELRQLAEPVPVRFFSIEGKHIGNEVHPGQLVALSDSGALLDTDAPLSLYDNLQLSVGGRLLCKVVAGKGEGRWELRFTAIPEGFPAWKTQNVRFL